MAEVEEDRQDPGHIPEGWASVTKGGFGLLFEGCEGFESFQGEKSKRGLRNPFRAEGSEASLQLARTKGASKASKVRMKPLHFHLRSLRSPSPLRPPCRSLRRTFVLPFEAFEAFRPHFRKLQSPAPVVLPSKFPFVVRLYHPFFDALEHIVALKRSLVE